MNSVYEQGWFESTIDKLERYAKEGKLCKADFGTIQKFVDERARYNELSEKYENTCSSSSNAATEEMGRLVTASGLEPENSNEGAVVDKRSNYDATIDEIVKEQQFGSNKFGQGFFQSVADGNWREFKQLALSGAVKAGWAKAKNAVIGGCENYTPQIQYLDTQINQLQSQIAQLQAQRQALSDKMQTCNDAQVQRLQDQKNAIDAQINSLKGAPPTA